LGLIDINQSQSKLIYKVTIKAECVPYL